MKYLNMIDLMWEKTPTKFINVSFVPEFVGAMPVKQDIIILPADDPDLPRLGLPIIIREGSAYSNKKPEPKYKDSKSGMNPLSVVERMKID